MLKAVTRQATAVDAKVRALNADAASSSSRATPSHPVSTAYYFDHFATEEDVAVVVTEQDFLDAHDELIPSVSAGELSHYEKVRAMFEGGRGGDEPKQQPPQSRGSRPGTAAGGSSSSHKGKGKAVAEDAAAGGGGVMNGRVNKGKGKAVAGFQDATASDDDDLY